MDSSLQVTERFASSIFEPYFPFSPSFLRDNPELLSSFLPPSLSEPGFGGMRWYYPMRVIETKANTSVMSRHPSLLLF